MTCVVGLVHNGVTYIGADSLGSNGYSKEVRSDKKVFHFQDSSSLIGGFTSSYRMGQLLMYKEGLIDFNKKEMPEINHKYMVTEFVPQIISLFETGGYLTNKSGEKCGGEFLVGFKDQLFKICSDFQVAVNMQDYNACGSGEDFALGSLYATTGSKLDPEERVLEALRAAAAFSSSVEGPFTIVNTENDKVVTSIM